MTEVHISRSQETTEKNLGEIHGAGIRGKYKIGNQYYHFRTAIKTNCTRGSSFAKRKEAGHE